MKKKLTEIAREFGLEILAEVDPSSWQEDSDGPQDGLFSLIYLTGGKKVTVSDCGHREIIMKEDKVFPPCVRDAPAPSSGAWSSRANRVSPPPVAGEE